MRRKNSRVYLLLAALLVVVALLLTWWGKAGHLGQGEKSQSRSSAQVVEAESGKGELRRGDDGPPVGTKPDLRRPTDAERKVNRQTTRKSQLEQQLEELRKQGLGERHPNVWQLQEEIQRIVEGDS